MSAHADAAARIAGFRDHFVRMRAAIGTVLVGHADTVDDVLTAFFAGGHALVEGLPGVGKTLLARSVGDVMQLTFRRIQFTVDLMPADVTGTRMIAEDERGRRSFYFAPGPIFSHVLLADEINRATPKTQAALLEAMGELQVTIAGETRALVPPFFVLATRNPIEMEGTYPLPEAQLDRFLFSVTLGYPTGAELTDIIRLTTSDGARRAAPVFAAEEAPAALEAMRQLVRSVLLAPEIERHIVAVVRATQPAAAAVRPEPGDLPREPLVDRYVEVGASPRGGQALALGAKVRALLDGRAHVTWADVDRVMLPALAHRLVPSFAAQAETVALATVIERLRERARAAWR